MGTIHHTASVDPSAELGADVEVGPGVIIEAGAVIGDSCRIQARAIITGHVRMGSRNTIGPGAIIGGEPQDFDFKPGTQSFVEIGNNNIIREYVTIHRGTKEETSTRIGHNNFLMVGVHLGHNTSVANRVVIANNCLLAGYVAIHDGAVLGGGSVFHQHIRVGRLCMVRGGERFGKDIPPFLIAYGTNLVSGLNSVGLRRSGISHESRSDLKKAFHLLYHEGYNTSQALEEARKKLWSPEALDFFSFVSEARKRGICAVDYRNGNTALEEVGIKNGNFDSLGAD